MSLARNRSMPDFAVLPVLNYRDVRAAVTWLCRAFGARERLRMGEHRAQLLIGEGAFIVAAFHGVGTAAQDAPRQTMLVRIDDVDAHMKKVLATQPDVALRKLDVSDWSTPLARHYLTDVASLPYVVVYGADGRRVMEIVGLNLGALDRAIERGRAP